MHFHIGVMEFVVFCMMYFILKAILLIVHLELRRNKIHTGAALTGLLS